jgi:hypothetical protein
MATEKLKFKLELYATMWDKAPNCKVFINDICKWEGEVRGTEKAPDIIEFDNECEEGENYKLIIDRGGKGKTQTVINEKGDILKDQLLHIKSIEIDEILIGALIYEGVYTPQYPEPWATQQREKGVRIEESFKNVTQMGHNGSWTLNFTSPFYLWLLENLY